MKNQFIPHAHHIVRPLGRNVAKCCVGKQLSFKSLED